MFITHGINLVGQKSATSSINIAFEGLTNRKMLGKQNFRYESEPNKSKNNKVWFLSNLKIGK